MRDRIYEIQYLFFLQAGKNHGFEKLTGLAVLDLLGMGSRRPLTTFGSGYGPAETSIIRIGRAALIPVAAAAHPFPALFFPGESHDSHTSNFLPYYSK
jgi:hypothetical protein